MFTPTISLFARDPSSNGKDDTSWGTAMRPTTPPRRPPRRARDQRGRRRDMSGKLASTEDFVSIQNLMGLYQWCVDEGDEEGYSNLFCEDGAMLGLPEVMGPPESFRGREGLKRIPAMMAGFGGKM